MNKFKEVFVMAVLECNVVTCVHNEDDKCCKGCIKVDGNSAMRSDATCCDSFDKRGCGCSNDCKCPDMKVDIECEAVNCVYNDSKVCKATHVGVVGHTADDKNQTECATFRCR